MFAFIKDKLNEFNIDLVSCISLDQCDIKRPYLLQRHGIQNGSVVIFAVPYLAEGVLENKNISAYVTAKDYHLFFNSLFEEILPLLKKKYPDNNFVGFTDHSPIDEIGAASKSGLGQVGKNHLLLTEKYSSYIFIGEIITDAILPSLASESTSCIGCNKCLEACPVGLNVEGCLSSLAQKKGELTQEEKEAIKSSGCAWGCDICQEICPYTKRAINNGTIFTDIDYFKNDLTPKLTSEDIENMSDELFKERAYSWRNKATIIRNLKILEGKES